MCWSWWDRIRGRGGGYRHPRTDIPGAAGCVGTDGLREEIGVLRMGFIEFQVQTLIDFPWGESVGVSAGAKSSRSFELRKDVRSTIKSITPSMIAFVFASAWRLLADAWNANGS